MRRSLLLSGLLLLLVSALVNAEPPSPVGVWKTIDDETHSAKALVSISEHGGVLIGTVTKLFRAPGEETDPRCKACAGVRHDQPVIGMSILWNMRREGDLWTAGEILDPESGRTYRCNVRLVDGGAQLEVRGYVGFALLGRTQIWERAEQ